MHRALDRVLLRRGNREDLFTLSIAISVVHVMNYLNYSDLRYALPFPALRAVVIVLAASAIAIPFLQHLTTIHARRSSDILLFCLVAIMSVVYSHDRAETLKYSVWLILSVIIMLEIARRVRDVGDLLLVSTIGIVPSTVVAFALSAIFGFETTFTGRMFGALGTRHTVDVLALSTFMLILMGFGLMLAGIVISKPLRFILIGIFAVCGFQIMFGLTRAVWVSALLSIAFFVVGLRRILRPVVVISALVIVPVIAALVTVRSPTEYLPKEVQYRIKFTEQRQEAGEIDPRIHIWRKGLSRAAQYPVIGVGYAAGKGSHNSYINIAIDLGAIGFLLMLAILVRSIVTARRAGPLVFMVFAVASGAMILHSNFEAENTPGQANFYPILLWIALSRSSYIYSIIRDRRLRRTARDMPAPQRRLVPAPSRTTGVTPHPASRVIAEDRPDHAHSHSLSQRR